MSGIFKNIFRKAPIVHSSSAKKYFISHSYKDKAIRNKLIQKLPVEMEPVVFPPIKVAPNEFVSNHLIDAILECDGLIYLRGGYSEKSFWVAFERDFALRAGKSVLAFDPDTLKLEIDTSSPLDLVVYAAHAEGDMRRVRKIVDYLKKERNFNVWAAMNDILPGSDWRRDVASAIAECFHRGGYQVVFWSTYSAYSTWIQEEIQYALKTAADVSRSHTLVAHLDKTPLPDFLQGYDELPLQLYGDRVRSEAHRLDDLIVRLYWLIYQNSTAKT